MKLFSKHCARRYANVLDLSEDSDLGGFSEPLLNLQLDHDFIQDRLKSSTEPAATVQGPPILIILSKSVQSSAEIALVELSNSAAIEAQLEHSVDTEALHALTEAQCISQQDIYLSQPQTFSLITTDGSTQALMSENYWIKQQAELVGFNRDRRSKELPQVFNSNILVDNYVEDLYSVATYAIHLFHPNDPRISEFADAIRNEDESLEQRNVS